MVQEIVKFSNLKWVLFWQLLLLILWRCIRTLYWNTNIFDVFHIFFFSPLAQKQPGAQGKEKPPDSVGRAQRGSQCKLGCQKLNVTAQTLLAVVVRFSFRFSVTFHTNDTFASSHPLNSPRTQSRRWRRSAPARKSPYRQRLSSLRSCLCPRRPRRPAGGRRALCTAAPRPTATAPVRTCATRSTPRSSTTSKRWWRPTTRGRRKGSSEKHWRRCVCIWQWERGVCVWA